MGSLGRPTLGGGSHSGRLNSIPLKGCLFTWDRLSIPTAFETALPEQADMLVTAHGEDERRRQADEWGAAQFLTKPLDFDQLKEQLRLCAGYRQ